MYQAIPNAIQKKTLKNWSMGIQKVEWECGKMAQMDNQFDLVKINFGCKYYVLLQTILQ